MRQGDSASYRVTVGLVMVSKKTSRLRLEVLLIDIVFEMIVCFSSPVKNMLSLSGVKARKSVSAAQTDRVTTPSLLMLLNPAQFAGPSVGSTST